MALVVTDDKHYQNIAREIREKTDNDKLYPPASMAEGVNEVFDAGKSSMIDDIEAPKKTISGKVISVNDVSKKTHEVAIQLSSDSVTDFAGVKVRVCGKNLMAVQPRSINSSSFEECYFLPKGTYTVCMDVAGVSQWRYTYKLYDKNGNAITETSDKATHITTPTTVGVYYNANQGRYLWATDLSYKQMLFTLDDDYYVGINYYSPTSGAVVTNGHIERGENYKAQYEPYEERTGIINADGTVEGITSISPNMTVFTDNADVDISMTYRQSKIIEKTVSGKIISVDDVSEVPHEVAIQLSSDTVTDFSGVTVKALGKNLATAQQVWKGFASYSETTSDGRNVVRFLTSSTVNNKLPIFEENTQYVISFEGKTTVNSTSSALSSPFIYVYYTDGTTSVFGIATAPTDWKRYEFVTTAGKTVKAVGVNSYTYTVLHWIDIDTFQFEKATVASEYEPYNERVFTPTANGTVEGITSISPNMTVFTDNADVDIAMTYHQSYGAWLEYNRHWDCLQNNGNEMDCRYLFYNWKDELYRPKHNIVSSASSAAGIYQNSRITDTRVDIDLSKAISCDSIFAHASAMKIIRKVIHGKSNTYLTNTYAYSPGLEEIRIEGVIPSTTSFQRSTLLSHDSIVSIITHLSDTATGMTLTLSKTAVTNAFGSTTAPEWTNLIATKSNWTISLV